MKGVKLLRLIDADALKSLYEGGAITDDMHVSIRVIKQNIDDMPTIEKDGILNDESERDCSDSLR